MAIKRIKSIYLFNLVTEKLHPYSDIGICRKNINSISPDPESAMLKFKFVSGIKAVDQLPQEKISANSLTSFYMDSIGMKIIRIAYPVNT